MTQISLPVVLVRQKCPMRRADRCLTVTKI